MLTEQKVGPGEELFPETPFLFVATRDRRLRYGTNVFSDTDWNGSLKLALELQPRTRQVFVITGASEDDLRALSGARQQFPDLQPRLDFTYLTGLRIEELERRVAALPPDSIIYYVNMSLDGAQRRFEGTTALDRIAAVANVPIYIQSQANLGRGALGGHLWSSLPWGLRSSEIVMRLLDGEPADAISPSKVEIYSAQLDWRQIQRWNIDQRRIPAGTRILFREPGLWEAYQGYVLGAVALMLLQSALIGGLANHPIDAGVPHLRTRGLRRQEVLTVANHARALRDLASPSRRVHVVVGVERHENAIQRRTLEILGDVGFRFGVGGDVRQREPEAGSVAGFDGESLNVGLQAFGRHADFVIPGNSPRARNWPAFV